MSSYYNTDRDNGTEPPLSLPTTTAAGSYTPPNSHLSPNANSNHRATEGHPSLDDSIRRHPLHQNANTIGSFGAASTEFTGDSFRTLNKLKESLPESVQPWFWLGLWFMFSVTIITLVVVFHSNIIGVLEVLASFIKDLGLLGPPVIMICLFATSFPPVIGYSSIVTMSGYVYGFVFGFIIAFSSALAGSIACFYLCRKRFKAHVRKLMAKNKSLKSVVRTVERRGFRLLVLIRLAPYPYNIMNALLSATHIPLHTFALATAISLIKLTLHVYIGSTLSSLTGDDDPDEPNKGHGKKVKVFVMIVGIILGIGVGAYVWMVAKREIAITEAARMERRRRRRQGGLRRMLDGHASRSGRNADGAELPEQSHIPEMDLTGRGSHELVVSGNDGSPGYHDEEDDGHEDQSLFGGLVSGRNQRQQRDDWRNVGANVDSATDSEEDSDFMDDDDDDDDEGYLNGTELDRNFRRYGDDEGNGQHEEEALDFTAHHSGLLESPWQDEAELEDQLQAVNSDTSRAAANEGNLGNRGW